MWSQSIGSWASSFGGGGGARKVVSLSLSVIYKETNKERLTGSGSDSNTKLSWWKVEIELWRQVTTLSSLFFHLLSPNHNFFLFHSLGLSPSSRSVGSHGEGSGWKITNSGNSTSSVFPLILTTKHNKVSWEKPHEDKGDGERQAGGSERTRRGWASFNKVKEARVRKGKETFIKLPTTPSNQAKRERDTLLTEKQTFSSSITIIPHFRNCNKDHK